jgi:PAS domain S-box-containing protein
MSKIENDSKTPEKKYFNLINSILDIVVELDVDLIINYINPQVYNLFGYKPEEVIGEKSIDFVHQDDVLKVVESIKKGIETRDIITENFRIRHKKGNYIPVSSNGRVVDYENQIRIVVVIRDIIKEIETEQQIKESDKRYREIIENIEDGYFETDLEGNFTYVNDYNCKYLGLSREELLGKPYTTILDNTTINNVFKAFNKVYLEDLPKGDFESEVIRSDGEKRTFEGYFYLKYDSSGKKVGFYGFTRDITERKMAEEKKKTI